MATATGYIITIVALENNEIKFDTGTKNGSVIYHAKITKDTGATSYSPGEAKIVKTDFEALSKELEALGTLTVSGAVRPTPTLPNLESVMKNTPFLIKTASKDDTTNKITVTDGKGASTIYGGKKRSQHKYSRKR